jgi:predicted Ser/Thr protein kinase
VDKVVKWKKSWVNGLTLEDGERGKVVARKLLEEDMKSIKERTSLSHLSLLNFIEYHL